MTGKWTNVALLGIAQLLAMSLWFSASAVIPQLSAEWDLTDAQKSWLTMSVQLGFVLGALASAALNLPDRMSLRTLTAVSSALGAIANAAIPFFDPGITAALWLRLLTGVALAGVYPPGMKLISTWCREDRGLGIGLLIGALVTGTALPHLLNGLPLSGGMPPWRSVLWVTSGLGGVAALLSAVVIRAGPFLSPSAPFHWRFAARALAHTPTRLANFGYLGHMWELYAMWAWVPVLLIASYEAAGWSLPAARLAGFAVIAIGALGSVVAGVLADRVGRTTVTAWSLAVSGACCLIAGLFFDRPEILTALCLVWGFAVVADSAQFSAAVTELTDPRYIGTALTVQTSLGFLLTLLTIWVVPPIADHVGWRWAFVVLAPGPALGIVSMLRLRVMPEAERMASGNR